MLITTPNLIISEALSTPVSAYEEEGVKGGEGRGGGTEGERGGGGDRGGGKRDNSFSLLLHLIRESGYRRQKRHR